MFGLVNFRFNFKLRFVLAVTLTLGPLICSNAIAVTNQELMDRLDDIEFEQQTREMNRLMDEYTRVMSQKKQSQSASSGRFKWMVKDTKGVEWFIDTNSITRKSNGKIRFTYHSTADFPRYDGTLTYFDSEVKYEIDCLAQTYEVMGANLQKKDLSTVKTYVGNKQKLPYTNQSILYSAHQFVCR